MFPRTMPTLRRRLTSAWPDLLVLVGLAICVFLGWSLGTGKSTPGSWVLPSAYLEPVKGDVIFHLALARAAADGHFSLFESKIVPELGAPGTGNWNDWPIVEEMAVQVLGLLTRWLGVFAGLDALMLIGHLLAAVTFYLVARHLEVLRLWSFVGGLAFGLAPYLFAQSPHHPFVQLCWHLPLFLLIWRWVAEDGGVAPGSGRFWFGVGVGILAGQQMTYYTAIFCQLVLLGALVAFLRTRRIPALVSAGCFIAASALAFGVMNLDTWMYRFEHGANPGALVREYKWLEIYGLKIVDLLIPPLVHQGEMFRAFAESHAARRVLQDEGSYLGLLGVGALLFLGWSAVSAVVRRHPEKIPLEAWQVLWIVLFFGTGGFNAVAGLFGVTMFRAGCRYSVVILAIVLLFAVERLSKWEGRNKGWSILCAIAACFLVIWDQVPRAPSREEAAAIASQVGADWEFVKSLESLLPEGAMVFQIPVMEFPESPVPGVPSYDHLRPYLYSQTLRFSFGTNKGREEGRWQGELARMSLPEAVAKIREKGFAALYINRNGFPDKGKGIEETLRSLGYTQMVNSQKGDLLAVILKSDLDEKPIKLFP